MRVADAWSEPGHPNQNFVESLGVKPIKRGAEAIMNRTGADAGVWPWAHKYVADVNNHCASPWLNWKIPIQVRHGYKPDISAFLQFQFWEKVYYRTDAAHPKPKEACGHFCGVCDHVGDKLTFEIWDPKRKNAHHQLSFTSRHQTWQIS